MAQELWLFDTVDEGGDTPATSHTANTGQAYQLADIQDAVEVSPTIIGGAGYAQLYGPGGAITVHGALQTNPKPQNVDYTLRLKGAISANTGFKTVGIVYRVGGGAQGRNHYEARIIQNGTLQLLRRIDSTFTTIDSIAVPGFTHGAVFEITVIVAGSNHKVYVGVSLLIDVNDSSLSGSGGNNGVGPYLGNNSDEVSGNYVRFHEFRIDADSPDTKRVTITETPVFAESLGLNEPCDAQEPLSGKTVYDNFDGFDNTALSDHVSDSGHAYMLGHGIRPFGASIPTPTPMILNGAGALVSPSRPAGGAALRDSRQLIFAPRTADYEIGACFKKLSSPFTNGFLSFYWRDTSTTYSVGPRTSRYEVRVGNNGLVQILRWTYATNRFGGRRGRGTSLGTILASSTGNFSEDVNNFLQIINDGDNIVVKINSVTVHDITDTVITAPGSISVNLFATTFAGAPKGYWTLNWLYVDDSYASFPNPNKAVVLSETFRATENLTKEEEILDQSFFVNIADGFNAIENTTLGIVEPTTKDIAASDAVSAFESIHVTKNSGCWYDEDWGFRKLITIAETMIPGTTDLTDFPVLISITDTDVLAEAQADGDDILFTASDGLTKLDHELVAYDSVTGAIEAWVRIPTLLAQSNTTIYMYFGNGAATAQENVADTWNANYRAVYHLEGVYDGTTGEVLDSTSNNFDGEASASDIPAQVDGQVGKAQSFDEDTREEIILDAANSMLSSPANITLEIWLKQKDTTTPASQRRIYLVPGSAGTLISISTRSTGQFVVATHNGTGFNAAQNIETIANLGTTYHYVAIKLTATNTIARLDKVEKVNVAETIGSLGAGVIQLSQDGANLAWDGDLDEFRISSVARSNDWLDACYNNQNAPGTYLSVGALQDPTICNTLFIGINETLLALDIPLLSGDKGIELLDFAHMNDPFGVAGNHIDKNLTISEFLNSEEVLIPSIEIDLTDSFEASEAVSRVFDFIETGVLGDTFDISAVLGIADTTTVVDNVALRVLLAIADSAQMTEIIQRLLDIRETATLGDLINLMRTIPGPLDLARASDRIQITRTSVSQFANPEKTYHARDLKTLFFVEKGKKVN